MRTRAALAAALLGGTLLSCTHTEGAPVVRVMTGAGPVAVRVEVAATPAARARGLMWRKSLPEGSGMLFAFPDAAPRSFWMKNTPISLDIVFIGPDRRVVRIAEHTEPFSTTPIPSRQPATWVLELPAGFCRKHGIVAGTEVEIPPVEAR